MAHDTTLNTGTGGDTIVTVDLALGTYPTGSGKLPASCLYVSTNVTTAPTPVTDTNGLPVRPATATTWAVTQSGSWTVAIAGTVPVSLASVPSHDVTNAGTFAVQLSQYTPAAGRLPVDGSGVTQPVSGTFWQPTQPVSGTVTANAGTGTFAISGAVTQSGTWNVGTVTTVSTVTAVTDAQVQGKAAEDAVASGNPVLTGLVARRARSAAMSADGDVVRATGDRYGRTQIVGVDLTVAALQVTASGDTTLVAAPGAGSRLKILRVEASNSHATTALTAGLKNTSTNSGAVFGKKYLPAAGGLATWTFPNGHIMGGDNEAFAANLSASGQVEYTVYYEIIAT